MELLGVLLDAIMDAFGRNTRVFIGCTLVLGVMWLLWLISAT